MTAMEAARTALKEVFGYEDFRPGQEDAVAAILRGREVMAVMPTGAGKSLCYQIPALVLPGITLVVSPLISLMRDQVSALLQYGVRAAYLNSTLTPRQYMLALDNARRGVYRIIYVAPERLMTDSFLNFAKNADIAQVVVDEAHCVSQWGQDFRPGYLNIALFLNALGKRPRLSAFTATATQTVRDDIVRLIGLKDPYNILTGFDRPNLFLEVRRPKDRDAELRHFLEEHKGQSGIVYCGTRKGVEDVTQMLQDCGVDAVGYHAGMGDEMRSRAQEDFVSDCAPVIVATNAFGMGIDKSNVSFVVHYNMPKDLESYYQEAGRAGRDGAAADCILLYSGADIFTAKWMIDHGEPNEELTADEQESVRREDRRRLESMIGYCTTTGCLRQYILRYFGEKAEGLCGHCGNCLGVENKAAESAPKPARKKHTENRPMPPRQMVETPEEAENPDDLLSLLKACRMKLAKQVRVPPYIICTDKTLESMVARQPQTLDEMLDVHGMGTAKVGKYGAAFLLVVRRYAAAHPRTRGRG